MIKFTESNHKYESIIPDNIQWKSVTGIVHQFVEPFDKIERAAKCSVRKPGKWPNKWYGIPPAQILKIWDDENNRSTELGHWYHSKKEQELLNRTDITIHPSLFFNGTKAAGDQRLTDGLYPEHLCYLQSLGICGQSDLVIVEGNEFSIEDHKTSKEIRLKGFENWEGTKKMLAPVQNLDDCEFNHYALQLSLYAYMIMKHNPQLTLKSLKINHVQFKIDGNDQWGYPIVSRNEQEEPIIDKIVPLELPYLSKEVIAITKYLQK